MRFHTFLLAVLLLPLSLLASDDNDHFILKLVPQATENTFRLTVEDKQPLWTGEVVIAPNEIVCEELKKGLSFCGKMSADGRTFRGFIKSGFMHYQVILTETEKGELEGYWNKLVRYEYPQRQHSDQYAEVRFAGYKY
ncbi:MAG: hypothetical protein AAF828_00105 [Bacteroidota bacterium]